MAVDLARVKSLFLAAAELADSAERKAYLDRECGGDAELRDRVQVLLRANDSDPLPTFLNSDAAESDEAAADRTADFRGQETGRGTVIGGRYTLVELIGEGGMGAVWRAKQTEPVQRFVAIKLIKAGMDSRQVLARFEAERQALALMDHPHIARVFDGGLHQHRPYFVMELVKGVPITEFCDGRQLPPPERLELFVTVCEAIQHAHQKGIIHRDIKPGNVLVALYDDRAVVKVIDFGVAKATGGTLTEHSLDTGIGAVVGTPAYMSPEQATLNNIDIDTRSDVYALGVLLFELLTGSPPFSRQHLEKKGLLEILRVIREDEPPRPSTKLSTDEALPSISANRRTNPKNLTGLLRKDLDWIVMKALEKDRSRRYETANAFAADVRRYQHGEAVLAHPPGAGYRLRKFVRRHKGQVIGVILIGVALLAGVIGTSIGLFEARRQQGYAQQEAAAKQRALDAEQKQRERAEKNATEAITARERESAQRLKAEKAYSRTADVLDTMVSEVTGNSLATQKKISEDQKRFLTEVLTYYQEFAEVKSDNELTRMRAARAAHRVSSIEQRLGRTEEALAAISDACNGFAALAADFSAKPEYSEMRALCETNRGTLLMQLGKGAEAEEQYLLALAIQEQLVAEHPENPADREATADIRRNLGNLLRSQGRGTEAVEQYRHALAINETLAADVPANPAYRQGLASSKDNLATMLSTLGQQAEAEDRYREAQAIREKLAVDFPDAADYRQELAMNHTNLGILLERQARGTEAEQQYRQAVVILEKMTVEFPAIPDYRWDLSVGRNSLANLLRGLGRGAEGEEQHRQALAIQKKLADEYPANLDYRSGLAKSHINLGHMLKNQGDDLNAEEQYRQAVAIFEKLTGEFPSIPVYRLELAHGSTSLGSVLYNLGRGTEGNTYFRQALAIQEKLADEFPSNPEYRQDLAGSRTNLSQLLADEGHVAEADILGREGLAAWEQLVSDFPANPGFRQALGVACSNRGILLAQWGKRTEAETLFRQAVALQQQLTTDFTMVPAYRQELARSHMNLGNLLNMPTGSLWDLLGGRKDGPEAEEEFRKALTIQETLVADFPDVPDYRRELAMSHNNMGIHLTQKGKKPEAEEHYRQGLAVLEQLTTGYPAVAEYRRSLGANYCNYGLLATEPPIKLDLFNKAVQTLTPVYQQDPNNATVTQFLVNSHSGRAVCYFELQQYAEAIADWDKVLELNPAGLHPMLLAARAAALVQVGRVAEAVGEIDTLTQKGAWPADQWYNFACVYAIASGENPDNREAYGDQALDCLKKAIRGGFHDAEHIAKDTDLDSLRDRDDFRKLVGSLATDSESN